MLRGVNELTKVGWPSSDKLTSMISWSWSLLSLCLDKAPLNFSQCLRGRVAWKPRLCLNRAEFELIMMGYKKLTVFMV